MTTGAALTWAQRALVGQPENNLACDRILCSANNIFPVKRITYEQRSKAFNKATEVVNDWHPGTLASIPETRGQIISKESNKYLV
jgi:hypothetical protein